MRSVTFESERNGKRRSETSEIPTLFQQEKSRLHIGFFLLRNSGIIQTVVSYINYVQEEFCKVRPLVKTGAV